MVVPLLVYLAQIFVWVKVVRTQTKYQQILILKIFLMRTSITVMMNIVKTGMTVMKKKMVTNCLQTIKINHEKKIMTKAKGSKICFWRTSYWFIHEHLLWLKFLSIYGNKNLRILDAPHFCSIWINFSFKTAFYGKLRCGNKSTY